METAKIAIMSSWKACCGVSIHAELVGGALLREGHELTVYAPMQYEDDKTRLFFAPDEEFVTRNYSFLRYGDQCADTALLDALYLDPEPMLDEDFDLFIVEKPTSTPLGRLLEVLPEIRRKARTMAVIHEGSMPTNPFFQKMGWDAVAVFDERYKALFSPVIPGGRMHIIPFPCHPVDRRNKFEARKKLKLPREAEIVFSFGRLHDPEMVLKTLDGLRAGRPELLYLYLAGDPERYMAMKALGREYEFLEVRFGRPPTEELYDYLGAADALVFNRTPPPHIAVSSSVHLCLGALTPILCSDVAYFETFGDELIKYRNAAELETELHAVLEGRAADVSIQAQRFLDQRSAHVIAERILEVGLGCES
ncbi:MAG: hypothetical protein ACE5OO_05485 [Candidatus Bathyarchaeia archaeon]